MDVTYLTLVKGRKDEVSTEVVVPASNLDTAPVDDLRLRGQLYDHILHSIREFARTVDPLLTIDKASDILVDFPLFLSELKVNWNGSGYIREMPNLPGQQAHCL